MLVVEGRKACRFGCAPVTFPESFFFFASPKNFSSATRLNKIQQIFYFFLRYFQKFFSNLSQILFSFPTSSSLLQTFPQSLLSSPKTMKVVTAQNNKFCGQTPLRFHRLLRDPLLNESCIGVSFVDKTCQPPPHRLPSSSWSSMSVWSVVSVVSLIW